MDVLAKEAIKDQPKKITYYIFCGIYLFAWFSLLLLLHRFLGLLLDFFLLPFVLAVIVLILAVAHRGIAVVSKSILKTFKQTVTIKTIKGNEEKELKSSKLKKPSLFSNIIIFLNRIEGLVCRKIFVIQNSSLIQSNKIIDRFRNKELNGLNVTVWISDATHEQCHSPLSPSDSSPSSLILPSSFILSK